MTQFDWFSTTVSTAAFIDWHKLKIYVALSPKLSQKTLGSLCSSFLTRMTHDSWHPNWSLKRKASPYLCEQWTHSSLAFTFLVNHLVTFNALKDFSNILARERPFSSYHCVHKAIRHSSHSKAQHCTFFSEKMTTKMSIFSYLASHGFVKRA